MEGKIAVEKQTTVVKK